MKKIIFLLLAVMAPSFLAAWEIKNFERYYAYGYDTLSTRNFLPDMAWRLENNHGISSYMYLDKSKGKYDVESYARSYFNAITKTPESRIILIYVSDSMKKGAIIISDSLKERFPERYVRVLQDDVLNRLFGKWYIRGSTVLTKILGGFVYYLEKSTMSKKEIEENRENMIILDDSLYTISLAPLIDDIIGLFYAEPMSFIIYFPFVMYFIIVRWAGTRFGRAGYIVSNCVWAGLMIFTVVLICNRLNIYFPAYVNIFLFTSGLNIPLYAYFFTFYSDEIGSATSNYIGEITGGFEQTNTFEGKKWEN